MAAFLYDQLNSFGKLTGPGYFPNVIDLGEASVERMTVDLKFPEGNVAGGMGVLSLEGSDMEDGGYDEIVNSSGKDISEYAAGYRLAVPALPKNKYRFLRLRLTNSFIGTVEAFINSYLGK